MAARVAATRRPDAIIALGVLIRGETEQYAAIGHAVANGLAMVSVNAQTPVALGVVMVETIAQAVARTGGSAGNRGEDAARSALEMVQRFANLDGNVSAPSN